MAKVKLKTYSIDSVGAKTTSKHQQDHKHTLKKVDILGKTLHILFRANQQHLCF